MVLLIWIILLYQSIINSNDIPQIHITIHNDSNSSSNQTITRVHSLYDECSAYFEKIYQDRYTLVNKTMHSCSDYIMYNKIRSILAITFSSYIGIYYQIQTHNKIINNNLAWHRWKSNITLEKLLLEPHQQLEVELLFMIQNYYTDPINPTNFIYSITQASHALEKELQALESQKKLYENLEWLQIASLFFVDQQTIEELNNQYKKVLFMKHIFSFWCTQYKIEKNR